MPKVSLPVLSPPQWVAHSRRNAGGLRVQFGPDRTLAEPLYDLTAIGGKSGRQPIKFL